MYNENEQNDVQTNVQNNEQTDVQSNRQKNVQSDVQSNGPKMYSLMNIQMCKNMNRLMYSQMFKKCTV